MERINIGILAHVDAGKTTLTERILFQTGVIRTLGSVDKGTTQTDTLDLEKARGITIKSAVVSFRLNDLAVNLIDTPGHTDFVAEVARSLDVLDAVVLVVSAVEGVQSQTRRLARAIHEAEVPLIIFVNKIDRVGARSDGILDDIRRKLRLRLVPLTTPRNLGERDAAVTPIDWDEPAWRDALCDLLAESNDEVIAEYERTGGRFSTDFLASELRAQAAVGACVPVYFGSAALGVGVEELLGGIERWLPPANSDPEAPPGGMIFKINRRPAGEKVAYARLFCGSLAVRQRLRLQRRGPVGELEEIEERITAIDRFVGSVPTPVEGCAAGEIVGLHGLRSARIGDWFGAPTRAHRHDGRAFPVPALESVVRPLDRAQEMQLRIALEQLAEQDPFIALRQRNEDGDISVRLYGDVQKEILTDTLVREYGVRAWFGPSRTICIERLEGSGTHVETIFEGENPFYATIGFLAEPAEPGTGLDYRFELGSLLPAYYRTIEESIHETLQQGLFNWEIPDLRLTLTHAGYSSVLSTGTDFRKLTPLVLLHAIQAAGTAVYEPIEELDIEIPEDSFGAVCGALINARAVLRQTLQEGSSHRVVCDVPTAEVTALERQLPGLTRGEASWSSTFAGYIPVSGEPPTRRRIGPNPLNRAHYLADVARGVS